MRVVGTISDHVVLVCDYCDRQVAIDKSDYGITIGDIKRVLKEND